MKPTGTIQAMQAGTDLTVKLHGVIGWDVMAADLAAILDTATPDKCARVVFEIYSPGGSVWEGNYICSRIRELAVPTEARVYIAASMATLIAVSCKRVVMAQNGRWLVHNPWTAIVGDAAELEKQARELRETEAEAAAIYAAKTGKTPAEMLALMGEETWITAERAKELGFVDELTARYDHAAYAELRALCLAYEGLGQAAAAAMEEDTPDVPAAQPDLTTTSAGPDAPAGEPAAGASPELAANREAVQRLAAENAQLLHDLADAFRVRDTAVAAADTATGHATAASAQVTALTTHRDDLLAQVARLTSERDSARADATRRETVIDDLRRRLRAFGAGLAGTDEDLDRDEQTGATWWQKVAEFREAGQTPEAAQLRATAEYPQLHAKMLREQNRNSKGR